MLEELWIKLNSTRHSTTNDAAAKGLVCTAAVVPNVPVLIERGKIISAAVIRPAESAPWASLDKKIDRIGGRRVWAAADT